MNRGKSKRGALVAAMAAAGLLVLPASAAAVTFGADLTQAPTNDCNQCAALTLTKTSGAAETGSPITGILVSARIVTRNAAATGNFRILHPTGNPDEYRNDGEAPVAVTADATPAGHQTEVFTQLPIQAGDRLGVSFPAQDVYFMAPGPSAQCALRIEATPGAAQPVGTAATYTTPLCNAAPLSYEILVAGTVEPDADGDGYGDQTQDQCPTNASTHGPCPTTPAGPAATQTAAPTKKCKKHKRSASGAKKKCRRHK